jgi:glucose-1-phosphate adenylyltransferase
VTISVIPSTAEQAEGFGLLKADATGKIVEFKEKPKGEALESMRVDTTHFGLSEEQAATRPYLASMGIYVFNYKKLVELLNQDTEWVDFGREIIPAAIENYNVQSHLFTGYWEDIGTIRAFYQASLDLASNLPKFNFFDVEAPIYTRSRFLPPSKFHDSEISEAMISEGCIIQGAHIRRSIIGLRSRVDVGAVIEDSIIMGSDVYQTIEEIAEEYKRGMPYIGIGQNSVIRGAIVDKNARIGADVKLINSRGVSHEDGPNNSYYIRDGIIMIPKNAIIPSGSVV